MNPEHDENLVQIINEALQVLSVFSSLNCKQK